MAACASCTFIRKVMRLRWPGTVGLGPARLPHEAPAVAVSTLFKELMQAILVTLRLNTLFRC